MAAGAFNFVDTNISYFVAPQLLLTYLHKDICTKTFAEGHPKKDNRHCARCGRQTSFVEQAVSGLRFKQHNLCLCDYFIKHALSSIFFVNFIPKSTDF